jgi:hypothetical protein
MQRAYTLEFEGITNSERVYIRIEAGPGDTKNKYEPYLIISQACGSK